MAAEISPDDPHPRRSTEVLDSEMSYVETGPGAGTAETADGAIVFLHGNPTSSYLWRNVIPHLAGLGRCLAPDLIGMGASAKSPAGRYDFAEHARYLDAWFDAVAPEGRVVLVGHDWGGALGFHWARRHAARVAGIAYMETIVAPLAWDDWPERARGIFQALRAPTGEEMILDKNLFVERILPASVLRGLSEAEMAVYRKPFAQAGEGRRPTLAWPREIPIDGEPAAVVETVAAYRDWLATSEVPKLFVNADPGSILVGRQRDLCRAWPNQTEVTVAGLHFIQEDSPDEIGAAVAGFVRGLDRP
jgi:haloalkane dehalogenase